MVLLRTVVGAVSLMARAPIRSFGLAGLIYLLFPRFASWQIRSMRFNYLWINVPDLSVDVDLQVGVTVWNPNWVGAHLQNATVELYRVPPDHHDDDPTKSLHDQDQEALDSFDLPFATAITRTDYRVPAHNSFQLMSYTSIRQLPLLIGLSFLHEIVTNKGVVKVRAMGVANVQAVKQEVTVWLDCLQAVNLYRLPPRLVDSECSYRFTNPLLTDYIKATGRLGPYLIEFFQSFDMTAFEEDSLSPVPIGEEEGPSGVIALVEE